MELKNAWFENTEESRKDAMKQMIDGKVFFSGNYRIFMDSYLFMCSVGSRQMEKVDFLWDQMTTWQIEVDWRENLSPENPRWCKVWANGVDEVFTIEKLDTYTPNKTLPFEHRGYSAWSKAEPVSDELADLLDRELKLEK